ncbi:MAG TPA: formylglycine-generating enzyme family protein [archaeon]|nr:formylglycine-generating enzyme family protein [archaeon]
MRRLLIVLVLAGYVFCSCDNKSEDIFYVDIVSPLDEGIGIQMVQVSAGTFLMGSNLKPAFYIVITPIGVDTVYNYERPVHAVTLDAFKISEMEITQEQYKTIMGTNPSKFMGFINLPVEGVSWYDAVTFCNKLSEQTGLEPCYNLETWECDYSKTGFRLPTEAEWEYACRAGIQLEYSSGDLNRSAWYVANSSLITHSGGDQNPNNAGLFDMQGNVWEWCNDYHGRYHCGSETNPTGPAAGYFRIMRGGSWASSADDCRSAARRCGNPNYGNTTIGFRVVRR